jgi:hypothetical protein
MSNKIVKQNIKQNVTTKEEVILTGHRLEFTLLACNPSQCTSVRTASDGHKYLILPLFDHNQDLHLLNIGESELALSFINKFKR